jgi:hypothetical protein
MGTVLSLQRRLERLERQRASAFTEPVWGNFEALGGAVKVKASGAFGLVTYDPDRATPQEAQEAVKDKVPFYACVVIVPKVEENAAAWVRRYAPKGVADAPGE